LFSADGSWGFPPVRAGRRQANVKGTTIAVPFFVLLYYYSNTIRKIKDNHNTLKIIFEVSVKNRVFRNFFIVINGSVCPVRTVVSLKGIKIRMCFMAAGFICYPAY
ncbi:hypothetical protein, partial [Domibacillus epiphyticus]